VNGDLTGAQAACSEIILPGAVRAGTAGANWAGVPHLAVRVGALAGSDLLSTLPLAAMVGTLDAYGLVGMKVPFPIAPLPHAMVWCSGRNRDPGLGRLRPSSNAILPAKACIG
jgi:hypothetical protein